MEILWVIIVGLAAGFLGGLLGVGGGILMVPAFLYLLRDHIPNIHVAVGTSMAVIVAVSIAGTIGHARGGRVNWQVVSYVAGFAVVGSLLGAYASAYVPRLMLRRLFAILLFVVAVKMFFSKPGGATPAEPQPVPAVGDTERQAAEPRSAFSGSPVNRPEE